VASEREWADDKRWFAARNGSPSGPLAHEFATLAGALMDDLTVQGVLERVTRAARAVVAGADLVSVTLHEPGAGFCTPVETDPLATRLDEIQYRLDEGPCVFACSRAGCAVAYSGDLGTGAEFPRFGPAAADLGVHSVLAVGLFPHSSTPRTGALNFYSAERRGLDERDRDLAIVLAAHASTALAATSVSTAADLERVQLKAALRSRDVIGQAKGILMERRGISADEAFDVLRTASQSLNVKLVQVAETLVERRAEL